MSNRLLTILLVLTVTAALLFEAGRSVTSGDRWREWLQLLTAQQIADTFAREVRVGPVTQVGTEGVTLDGLAVAEGETLADGIIVSAERIRVEYDLAAIASGAVAPAAGINRVRIEEAWLHAVRDRQGELNLQKILPEPGEPAPPEERFRGVVEITDTRVAYEDYALPTASGAPVYLELDDIDVTIDMRRMGWAQIVADATGTTGRIGEIAIEAETELETGFAWAEASVRGLNAAWAYRMFAPPRTGLDVRRARVDVDASVGLLPGADGEMTPTVSADVRVRNAALRLEALGGREVTAEADLYGTTDGVNVEWARAKSGGVALEASGFMGNFEDPVVDLTFDASVREPDELLKLAPPGTELPEQAEMASIAGPLLLTGRMTGPIAQANISARVGAPGQVRYADAQLGQVEAGPIDLRVNLLDLADPNVRARAEIATVQPLDLGPLRDRLAPESEGELAMAPLEDLRADVLWSAETPLAQTRIELPGLALGDVAVEAVRADVALLGDTVRVRDLYAEPLGATMTAQGLLDLSGEDSPWVYLRGTIDGLDLTRLGEVPGLEATEGASGMMSGTFAGTWSADGPMLVSQAVFERPGWQEHSAESLRGLVVVDENAVQIRGASFYDALGTGWVRGVMPFDGEMVASFGMAGIDLAQVRERFDLEGAEGLRGEVFVTGNASGSFEDPHVEATVQGFGLRWQDYRIDGMLAEFSGGLERARLERLYASAGRILVRASGELTEIDLEHANARIDGSLTVAGPVDESTRRLADLEDHDITGAVRAEAELSGTLRRPAAQGQLYLDFARYGQVATDDASLALRLEGDVLELEDMRVPVGDAVVSGRASLTSLYDTPVLSASVSAENVVLQDLAVLQEVGLPLSGRVNLPYLRLEGPLDGLTGTALVEASDLELGDEEIGRISAVALLDKNTVTLRHTTIALAGGTLALQGTARLDEMRLLPSDVALNDVSIPKLLQVAVPIARTFADVPAEEREEGQRPLSQQLAAMSMRLDGRMDGSLTLQGLMPEIPEEANARTAVRAVLDAVMGSTVHIALRDPALDGKPLPDTTLEATVAEGPQVMATLEATEGDALITADGTWQPDGTVSMLTEVSALPLGQLKPWLPAGTPSMGGQLNVTMQATGSVERPDVIASIDIIEPEVRRAQFDLISAPIISYDGESLKIVNLVVREEEEEFFVNGTLPFDWASKSVPADGVVELTARAEGVDVGIFPPLIAQALAERPDETGPLGEVEAIGTLDALVEVGGTVAGPELTGEIAVSAPTIQTPWLSSPIEDLTLAADLTGGQGRTRLDLKKFSLRAESVRLQSSGWADLTQFALDRLHENEYHFTTEIGAERQTLAQGLVARNVRGSITLETIEGVGEEPGASGDTRQLVTISDLGANFGDGSFTVDGTVGLTSFEPSKIAHNDFDITIAAKKARPRYANLFLGTIDGTIVGRNPEPGQPVEFTGGMEISHAVFGMPRTGGDPGGELHGMPADFPSPRLKVWLAIGPDVRVKASGMTAPLEPSDRAITLVGTPQDPVIRGAIAAQEGEATIPGGVLNIGIARVEFLVAKPPGTVVRPPVPLELRGIIRATATRRIETAVINGRQVGPINIMLDVSGTLPDNIHVQATAQPPLAEEQIYALLGMAPFEGGEGFAEAGDLEDVMTEQFVAALGTAFRHYVFQPFEEELKQLLGLSVLQVNFAFDQPVSVRLGGYLVEDLLVTYDTEVGAGQEQEYDIGVSYKVRDRFEISYRTDERGNNRMFVEYVRQF